MLVAAYSAAHARAEAARPTPCPDLTPLTGEATAVPGLVLVPAVRAAAFTGHFTLLHRLSGIQVAPDLPLSYAREAALWLARQPLDWDRPAAEIRDDPRANELHTALLLGLHKALGISWSEPLFYARDSWVHAAPPWRVWRRDRPTATAFPSFSDAVALADRGTSDPDDTVRRDEHSPGWTLRCAAPLCGTGSPAWLAEDDDTPLCGSRDDLIAEAAISDWRSANQRHWVCPDCVHAHQQLARCLGG